MEIAGVDFLIQGGKNRQTKILDPVYKSFHGHAVSPSEALTLPIRLQFGKMPEVDQFEKIFDTVESWAMYRNGAEYWLKMQPPGFKDPFWLARFKAKAAGVRVYCQPPAVGKKNSHAIVDNPICYPLDQLLLMHFLSTRQGILLHAAGVVRRGKAMIFPGCSGAGKSTFSKLLAEARVGRLLSDERLIVREINGAMRAFGTPWTGTAGIARNANAPLAGIYFLKHGQSNRMRKLAAGDILEKLLPLVSIPWYDPDTMSHIIAFAKHLLVRVPVYEMSFKPDGSAVDFFWKFQKTLS